MKERILLIIIWLFPYSLLGEETGAYLLLTALSIYLLFLKKEKRITVNQSFLFLLGALCVLSLITVFFSINPMRSLYGVSLSATAVLAYLTMKDIKEEFFIKTSYYAITFLAVISLLYQGIIRGMRIYGNFGYANTFALVLFIGIVFSQKFKESKLDFYMKLVLMTALFFTGDRSMLLGLAGWTIYRGIRFKEINLLLHIMLSAVYYLLTVKLEIAALFLAPILILLLNGLYQIFVKLNPKMVMIMVLVAFAALMTQSANTLDRLKNISFDNASLVERLISFEDAIVQVPENLMGHGANSYEYSQYSFQSAFYESKYVHNSLLQYLFDYGIVGLVVFAAIIGFGFYLIITTSRNEHKDMYLVIFAAIFLHSLLNFDLVYPLIWVLLTSLVAFCSHGSVLTVKVGRLRWLVGLLGMSSLLFAFHEGTMNAAEASLKKEKPGMAESLLTVQSKLNLPDDRVYFIKAGVEKLYYDQSGQMNDLTEAEKNLAMAQKWDEVDPRIKWNQAIILEQSERYQEAEKIWKQVVAAERYNPEVYKVYKQFLKKKYADDPTIINIKLVELRALKEQNRKELNPKAYLLPKQIGD